MRSTFMGLETSKRALFTQQSALYTTGHNIANANTTGYTRQRINFETTLPYPSVGLNRPELPGQIGTGVEASDVQRLRDKFLDIQYRTENTKLGYWSARADAFIKVEDVMNEPTEDGLNAVMGEMWQSLQDLSATPENEGARGVVIERAQAVADTFNYLNDSLSSIKKDFGNQLSITMQAANSVLKQLHDVNVEISKIEPNGYIPNDLYDRRDVLVDELSNYMNIKISSVPSGGVASKIAEGIYEIHVLKDDGTLGDALLTKDTYTQLSFVEDAVNTDIPGEFVSDMYLLSHSSDNSIGGAVNVDIASNDQVILPNGELRGLIEGFGFKNAGSDTTERIKGVFSNQLHDLDQLAISMATLLNEVHKVGFDLNGNQGTQDIFTVGTLTPASYTGAAGLIQLNGSLTAKDLSVSMNGEPGDGKNAINLGNVGSMLLNVGTVTLVGTRSDGTAVTYDIPADLPLDSGSLNTFYESVIGRLGVDSRGAQRMSTNIETLRETVSVNRSSVSSVSLDEEMSELIKYQHAYNGAARMITIMDEMLDKIINGMGVAGR